MKNERNLNYARPKNSTVRKMSLGSPAKSRHKDYTRHHRKPKSKGGSDNDRNICLIPRKYHEAYHMLFGIGTPEEVCDVLNKYFIDPDYLLVPHRVLPEKENPNQLKLFEDEKNDYEDEVLP